MKATIFSTVLMLCAIVLTGCGGGSTSENGIRTLSWVVPTQRANGDILLLSEIKGYRFCYTKAAEAEVCTDFDVTDPAQSEYILADLLVAAGVYQITLATIDTNNIYSVKSSVLDYTIN
jgi:hypothetical protein